MGPYGPQPGLGPNPGQQEEDKGTEEVAEKETAADTATGEAEVQEEAKLSVDDLYCQRSNNSKGSKDKDGEKYSICCKRRTEGGLGV